MSENELRRHLPGSFATSRTECCRSYRMKNGESVDVSRLFEKKFHFTDYDAEWCLPKIEILFRDDIWKIEDLQSIKEELNAVKSKLNDYDLDDWHRHTKAMSKTGAIHWKLKNEFEPEFVTQAWCKFYENVMSFPLVPHKVNELKNFNSFHLCEAPGAFITSLNHFLKLHHPDVKWNWKATTLNPYYEGNPLTFMINDDRFILQTLSNWTFGCDYTGNIMNLNNVNHLVQEAEQIGEILLVTADGSIDCHINPAEQECVVSSLHYYETIAALNILGEGGSFLLKIFTTHEAQTICLLYLLCCAFRQVSLFKPATSKEGNSEVYVICLKYNGRGYLEPWLNRMKDFHEYEFKNKAMFPLKSIPENFIKQLISCSTMYKDFQVEAIENNIQMYGTSSYYNIKQLKYLTVQHFVKRYRMKRLNDESKEVVGKHKLNETTSVNLDAHVRKGSFNDKLEKKYCGLKKLLDLEKELRDWKATWTAKQDIRWLKMKSSVLEFDVTMGKPINILHSSKFCSKHFLKIWNDAREAIAQISGSNCTNNIFVHEIHTEYNCEILTSSLNEIDSCLTTNLKIVNIRNDYWSSLYGNTNDIAEKRAFNEILDTINKMQKGENLLLSCYPLLTQFNVGVLYLMASLFKKIGFIHPVKYGCGIIFVDFQPSEVKLLAFLNKIMETCTEYTMRKLEISVLAVVPITELCGSLVCGVVDNSLVEPNTKHFKKEDEIEDIESSVSFCRCVTEKNNVLMKEQMLRLISDLAPKR